MKPSEPIIEAEILDERIDTNDEPQAIAVGLVGVRVAKAARESRIGKIAAKGRAILRLLDSVSGEEVRPFLPRK